MALISDLLHVVIVKSDSQTEGMVDSRVKPEKSTKWKELMVVVTSHSGVPEGTLIRSGMISMRSINM